MVSLTADISLEVILIRLQDYSLPSGDLHINPGPRVKCAIFADNSKIITHTRSTYSFDRFDREYIAVPNPPGRLDQSLGFSKETTTEIGYQILLPTAPESHTMTPTGLAWIGFIDKGSRLSCSEMLQIS